MTRFFNRRPAAAGAIACAAAVLSGCGSHSKSTPAATTTAAPAPQNFTVKLTDAGCARAKLMAKKGSITIKVVNDGTAKVTELELLNKDGIILGERENIVPGISGAFTLNLEPGLYLLKCPNGNANDDGVLVVSGTPTPGGAAKPDPLLIKATVDYSNYVSRQTDELVASTNAFVAALRAGNLAKAKSLFGPTRFHYETIEPVAESFGDLDPRIDARVNDVASTDTWTGFHRIEQILWEKGTTKGTKRYAAQLLRDVQTLDRRARTLTFQPAQLANGSVELLNEVANGKITGEEDRYSHTDLSDFQGNLTGAQVAFQLLRPALAKKGHGALANTIADRFQAVQQHLDEYTRKTPLGFALYGELTPADRLRFSQEVGALAEPLSTVAAKVSG